MMQFEKKKKQKAFTTEFDQICYQNLLQYAKFQERNEKKRNCDKIKYEAK